MPHGETDVEVCRTTADHLLPAVRVGEPDGREGSVSRSILAVSPKKSQGWELWREGAVMAARTRWFVA